jgi:hypothetical protein
VCSRYKNTENNMSRKKAKADYRKIYENHYGPIPSDNTGRTFEVHHVDGNHENNEPSNLIALSIVEHYEIHHSQGDWSAARLIALRMNMDKDVISELTRKSNLERVENGTHPWLRRPDGFSLQQERMKDPLYRNPFSKRKNGTSVQTDRVDAGTHHLLGGEIQKQTATRLLTEGKHPFQNHELRGRMAENRYDRLKNGNHIFSPDNNPVHKQIEDGKNPFLIRCSCIYCRVETDMANFMRIHGDNCVDKDSTNHFLYKVSCVACREMTDIGNHTRLHGKNCPILDPNRRIELNGKFYSYPSQAARDTGMTARQVERLNRKEKKQINT